MKFLDLNFIFENCQFKKFSLWKQNNYASVSLKLVKLFLKNILQNVN